MEHNHSQQYEVQNARVYNIKGWLVVSKTTVIVTSEVSLRMLAYSSSCTITLTGALLSTHIFTSR